MNTARCSQCGKPAIGLIGDHPVCVDCYLKFQQANQMYEANIFSYMNFLISQMEASVGLYGVTPRFEIPQPIIHHGSVNFHNIKVDRSNIGVINTGEIKNIEIARTVINKSGNAELTEEIRRFTEAVIAEKELNKEIKNQIIEQISFLATQAAIPKEKRKANIAKTVLKGIKDTLASLSSLTTIITSWDKLMPLFENIFNQ